MLAHRFSLSQVFHREVWWAEFWSAVSAVLWASLAMMSQRDLLSWPSLLPLAAFGGSAAWETAGVVLGVLQVAVLLSGYRSLRWGACFCMATWWMLLALSVLLNDPSVPSGAFYTVNAAINLLSLWKLWSPDGR